ncbi:MULTISPECIES: DUF1266 domain-containing protein [Corynebacterium]|uniref:DUF1266 domain-containing protein n=1 Tax=Corynebacterium amycolatum TaxID=43765 RepID=A0AB38XV30_CORAY|nr:MULTISPECIES: DUF1266 domain-containing protein [Corynebacterium]AIN81230.1 hypothetical protein DR71_768 [Corynebacterium sp. ATCC 6931]KAA9289246.1 DUF1266 domain-containing protein [Corynebacterium amycolatum]MBC6725616.1 DUF1266 domain-containing protein [Corynebacterium amycolatum]MBC6765265.1 DUF1266 domain-containing protein [Corynebacterium sp. LK22]MCA0443612.1 DUF1266 domain-containing protein [Corynebacterium amycolatum]
MSPTFTPAKFDDSSLYRFAKFPWPEPAPSKDEVRRHSWGMTYKHNKAFATPLGVENINARAVKYYKASLEQNWGVTGAQEAHQVIDALLEGNQHVENDLLLPLAYAVKDISENELEAEMEERIEFLKDFFVVQGVDPRGAEHKFRYLVRMLRSENFAKAAAPALPATTRAWDIIRIHSVGGAATELGWISPEEFLQISDKAVAALQRYFVSWADVAASFWWGRMIWASDGEPDVAAAMKDQSQRLTELLAHSDSPWVRVPLHDIVAEEPFSSLDGLH